MKVGLLVADYSQLAAATGYGSDASEPDPQRYNKWLVAYYNAHGGLAGRKIDPVYYTIEAGNDWDRESAAACASFTQDHHVQAVLTTGWVHPVLSACLARAHVLQIEGGVLTNNDEHMLGTQSPNLFVPAGMASDREARTVLTQSIDLGWLSSKDKLGILLDSCPQNARADREVIEPLARSQGITTDPYVFACGNGGDPSSTANYAQAVQSAVLKMKTDHVTKVMFLGMGENGDLVFFANAAKAQDYHPIYLLSSLAAAVADESLVQKDQLVNVRGIGWLVGDTDGAEPGAAAKRCEQEMAAGGGPVPAASDLPGLLPSCDSLGLLATALVASRGASGLDALHAAIESLGSSFASSLTLSARTRFAAGRHDGATVVAPFAYQTGCSCIRYVGPTRPAS